MTVSTRYKLLGIAGAAALGLAMSASWATPPKHGSYGKRPSSNVNVNIHGPKTKVIGPSIHGPKTKIVGPQVFGPKIKVDGPTIKGPTIIDGGAFAGAFAGASSSSTVIVGGGGGFVSAAPVGASAIGELNVNGAEEFYYETVTEKVPVTKETCIEKISHIETVRPVRAICLDDKNVPHPASQLNGEEMVEASYNGEIFRCVAGTYMQVTLGNLEHGEVNWDHGESFSCRKGEALTHRAGGGLVCVTQKPQRDCNERSLLRRYRTGIKLVRATQESSTCELGTETTYETRTRQVKRVKQSKSIGGGLVLDGGVGQGVF